MNDYPLLVARNVRKAFPYREKWWKPVSHSVALADVSIEVNRAEIVGLLGESGSGKSTLARIIVGLMQADAGSLTFDGRTLFGGAEPPVRAAQRGVQMVFQDPYSSLNPRMRVEQLIGEGLRIAGRTSRAEIRDRVTNVMRLVGLDPKDRALFPHQFSGGQRQRISIARAFVMEPKLLIADEAVSALDVSVQMQILDLRETMGLSILFITHNLAVVDYLCDRVAVIENGKIVESGRTNEVFDHPQQPYTKALLAAAPSIVAASVSPQCS
jgi:ABC-type microcin C transport system duplicated ATPase subunit YejF